MSHANAFMWFMIGLLTVLVAYRLWERSTVRRLRAHVQRLHDERREAAIEVELTREEAVTLRETLEATLVDWKRAEKKLARARTSRARWQAHAANWQRMHRNEFKRADQAEARLMRWQYDQKYNATAPAFKVVGELQAGQLAVKAAP